MRRSASQSLPTVLLAAIDLGLGSVIHQYVWAPLGLLLVTVGLLVIVGALTEFIVQSQAPATREFERAAPE